MRNPTLNEQCLAVWNEVLRSGTGIRIRCEDVPMANVKAVLYETRKHLEMDELQQYAICQSPKSEDPDELWIVRRAPDAEA